MDAETAPPQPIYQIRINFIPIKNLGACTTYSTPFFWHRTTVFFFMQSYVTSYNVHSALHFLVYKIEYREDKRVH
jgi:hypothetical protein